MIHKDLKCELSISEVIQKQITKDAEAKSPEEMCGFLFGYECNATRFQAMENVADSKDRNYAIDPVQQIVAFKNARKHGETLVGIVHSHIAKDAYPSPRDIDCVTYPEAVFVIASVRSGHPTQLRAYKIHNGKPIEVLIFKNE